MDANEQEARILKATFAGWKLDLISALASDRSLKPADVRVALVLVKHLNQGSFAAYPSQETIAEVTHMTVRNVMKCLDRLKASGWLRWQRGNRQKPNLYEFDDQKVADEVARMKEEDRARSKRAKSRRKPASEVNHSSGQKDDLTRTTVHVATRTTVPPNTYKEQGCHNESPEQEDAA